MLLRLNKDINQFIVPNLENTCVKHYISRSLIPKTK